MNAEKTIWRIKLPVNSPEEKDYRDAAMCHFDDLLDKAEPWWVRWRGNHNFELRGLYLDYLLLQGLQDSEIEILRKQFCEAQSSAIAAILFKQVRFVLVLGAFCGLFFHWWTWYSSLFILLGVASGQPPYRNSIARYRALKKVCERLQEYSPHYYDPFPEWRERQAEKMGDKNSHV